jgi:hypothetical protein
MNAKLIFSRVPNSDRAYRGFPKKRSDCGTFFCDNHHVGAKLKAKITYVAILFSEHFYDKRYKCQV